MNICGVSKRIWDSWSRSPRWGHGNPLKTRNSPTAITLLNSVAVGQRVTAYVISVCRELAPPPNQKNWTLQTPPFKVTQDIRKWQGLILVPDYLLVIHVNYWLILYRIIGDICRKEQYFFLPPPVFNALMELPSEFCDATWAQKTSMIFSALPGSGKSFDVYKLLRHNIRTWWTDRQTDGQTDGQKSDVNIPCHNTEAR